MHDEVMGVVNIQMIRPLSRDKYQLLDQGVNHHQPVRPVKRPQVPVAFACQTCSQIGYPLHHPSE
jgi:hypothetical protein